MCFPFLPFILFDGFQGRTMVLSGLILFTVGGVIPLISQINALPAVVLITSLFEIFFQNFLTGLSAAYLLYRKKGTD
jgi:hypothetical protein